MIIKEDGKEFVNYVAFEENKRKYSESNKQGNKFNESFRSEIKYKKKL